MATSINEMVKCWETRNLWKHDGKYFRLFGKGTTPNNCWVIAPVFVELIDIDVATGNDVYGPCNIKMDTGTASAYDSHIRY